MAAKWDFTTNLRNLKARVLSTSLNIHNVASICLIHKKSHREYIPHILYVNVSVSLRIQLYSHTCVLLPGGLNLETMTSKEDITGLQWLGSPLKICLQSFLNVKFHEGEFLIFMRFLKGL